MLTAVLHGKAGRVEVEGRAIGWRELFRQREDLLTGVLFGRLPYLSDGAQEQFLTLLLGAEIASELGTLQEITFWPKLRAGKYRGFVEPDVLMDYPNHQLLVEVKPPYSGSQRLEQWRAEVRALQQEDGDPKPIVLLALGRNPNHSSDMATSLQSEFSAVRLRVVCREWQEVMKGLTAILASADTRGAHIIEDWLQAFGLFGMTNECAPFIDLLPLAESNGRLLSALDSLKGWRSVSAVNADSKPIDWHSLMPLVKAFEKDENQWN